MYKMPWGEHESIHITVPESWRFCDELLPRTVALPANRDAVLREALACPYDCQPLRERDLRGKRICIVIDDATRPTPVSFLFSGVWEELRAAGADKAHVSILVAVGTHGAMSREDIRRRLGLDSLDGFDVCNNNAYDETQMAYLGTTPGGMPSKLNKRLTDADQVILIGTIEPHLLAGFGGGLKNVLPGCASADTIAYTHLNGPAEDRYYNVGKMGEAVPSRVNLEAAALMYKGSYFIVNTVLTHEKELVGVFCGDPIAAHRAGCRLAAEVYCAKVHKRCDVLFLNSHPVDYDIRQGSKCFLLSHEAVRDGGVLVAMLYCAIGAGDIELRPPFLSPALTSRFAKELGTERLVEIREELQGTFSADEKFMNQMFVEVARKYKVLVYAPQVPQEMEQQIGGFELYHDMDRLMARVAELAPENARYSVAPASSIVYAKYVGEQETGD